MENTHWGDLSLNFFKFQNSSVFSVDISLCNSEYKHHMSRGVEWNGVMWLTIPTIGKSNEEKQFQFCMTKCMIKSC